MNVGAVSLVDFRSYSEAQFAFAPGLTAVLGRNGRGKTNLLEAVGFMAGIGSLRGAPDEALVRSGAGAAVVRGEITAGGREQTVEIEIARSGRNRVLLNRQRVSRLRELAEALTVTVFSPDDLQLVKGSPARRRRWLDEALVACRPAHEALRADLDRILRQRNTALRQAKGRVTPDMAVTLDVWDAKLAESGDRLRHLRRHLLSALQPRLASAYAAVAGAPVPIAADYVSSWGQEPLAEALAEARSDDVRRGVTTVGPHRDDVSFGIGGLAARTHASQGEQRSLALALRLAADGEVREQRSVKPVLLLDDVFSELDPARAGALAGALPDGQKILTSATGVPPGCAADQVLRLDGPAEPPGER